MANALRTMTKRRTPVFGTFVAEFDTPGMGHILAAAGCDFCFLDMEHSGFTVDRIKRSVRYYEAAGVPLIVRPPSKAYGDVAGTMDAGAEGICLPCVDSGAEARHLVAMVKYPPEGGRGIGLQLAHDNYRAGDAATKIRAANRRSCVILQIESAKGAENVDAIAATKGVDALWIGHFDLSASLGIPGQFDHPDFRAAVKRTAKACEKHGRSLGILCGSPEHGLDLIRQGFNLIGYSGDAWLLRDALGAGITAMREGLKKKRRRAPDNRKKS
jgi:2-dehydro-3-deoxyglucarate aldolase/4-hydroxy-2-oxoheptanedioate aldolase